ncbi:MAG: GWxTD domain-containing protein [Candidatus Korobacteraceae bacterium]
MISVNALRSRWLSLFLAGAIVSSGALAAQSKKDSKAAGKQPQEEVDPLKRPLTEEQIKKQQKALKQELGRVYKKWLDEDVRWIITDEERAAFNQLSNDEERDSFIEQFWLRRDPTPDTLENETKDEHYRRIAYANERFASGMAGWRTDRGRIYVMYGKPDEIESHPTGGIYIRPIEEGGGETVTYPFEIWRYRYLEGIGQEILIEFVDQCSCNAYEMTIDRGKKDALMQVPGAGMTLYEQMGMSDRSDRFTQGLETIGRGPFNATSLQSQQFDRLQLFAKLQRPPEVKFKDLEEVVSHKISINLLPFEVRADFVRVTSDTVLVPITLSVKNRDVTFVNKDGIQRAAINIFGRITTLTGRVVQTFEDVVAVDQPEALLPKVLNNASIYWKALPLRAGRYRVDLVLKDVNGDRMGTWAKGLNVPEYSEEQLASSTLILADLMEKVPSKQVGGGNFVLGDTKVRPRVDGADGKPASFKRGQRVNFWMQVYNLGVSEENSRSDATIEYEVVNLATNKKVIHKVETTKELGNVGNQVTLEKSLPSSGMEPGMYRMTIRIADNVSKQNIAPTAQFAIE